MSYIKDISNTRRGPILIIQYTGYTINNKSVWKCKCDCGREFERTSTELAIKRKSCGYSYKLNTERKTKNLTGQRFGKLIVKEYVGKSTDGKSKFLCLCDCGQEHIARARNLLQSKTRSCGCLVQESNGGINSHFYIDGSSNDPDKPKRDGRRDKNWRKCVKKRDNYECVVCGTSKSLEAHHLNSYLQFPSQRYDIENGVTMCQNCHICFHNKYGKHVTRHMFLEFLLLLTKGCGWPVYLNSKRLRNSLMEIEKEYLSVYS